MSSLVIYYANKGFKLFMCSMWEDKLNIKKHTNVVQTVDLVES